MLSSLYFCSELLCTPWNSYINHFFYQLIFIFLQPHTLESLHIFTDIYSKKKKKSFQPYPLTLLWYWALQIIFIKLSIQFNLSIPFFLALVLPYSVCKSDEKKKKYAESAILFQVCFHALLNDTLYNSFYRSGLRLLCDFLHLNMFLYSSRQYSTIRLW